MGKYLNPPTETKEQWLQQNAVRLPGGPPTDQESLDDLIGPDGRTALICWVDNGPFSAAAWAYDQREIDAFSDPSDTRPKLWFFAERALVEAFFR